jgi:hypothetical protein
VTALYGSGTDSWTVSDPHPGLELNGVVGGRFDYSLGYHAGANMDVRTSQSFYGHIGGKIGGLRLDGEGGGPADPMKPWAENALTLDAFVARSASHYLAADGATARDDSLIAFGGSLRGQLGSFELNSGVYMEQHDRATDAGGKVNALCNYNEISYVVFPWFVPSARLELSHLAPAKGGSIYDLRVTPALSFLVRPNIKTVISGNFEQASGSPVGGWGAAGGAIGQVDGKSQTVKLEVEAVNVGLAFAF